MGCWTHPPKLHPLSGIGSNDAVHLVETSAYTSGEQQQRQQQAQQEDPVRLL